MATCTQSINQVILDGSYDSVPRLYIDTVTPFNIGLSNSKLFMLKLSIYQKITFKTNVTSQYANFTIEIYYKTGVKLASAIISNNVYSVDINLERGDYFICLSTTRISVIGTILALSSEYAEVITFDGKFYFGNSLKYDLYVAPPITEPCKEPIYMEIIDGELPEGLSMDKLGRIAGYLPNMDCTEANLTLSPSNNWMFQDGSMWYPWGRQYRFKVKAYMDSGEGGLGVADPIEDWFCVRVFNNWDFDRDNFINQMPFNRIITRTITQDVEPLPVTMCVQTCEPPYKLPFVPQPLNLEPSCDVCNDDTPNIVIETIKIPSSVNCGIAEVANINDWWDRISNMTSACKEVSTFIDNLKKSSIFQALLTGDETASVSVLGSSLDLVQVEYDDANDITKNVIEMRDLVNNSNDLYFRLSFGNSIIIL